MLTKVSAHNFNWRFLPDIWGTSTVSAALSTGSTCSLVIRLKPFCGLSRNPTSHLWWETCWEVSSYRTRKNVLPAAKCTQLAIIYFFLALTKAVWSCAIWDSQRCAMAVPWTLRMIWVEDRRTSWLKWYLGTVQLLFLRIQSLSSAETVSLLKFGIFATHQSQ